MEVFRSLNIGKSRKIQEISRLLEDLADTDTTVLITGESGTGKELFARAVHYESIRSAKPLVTVNSSSPTPPTKRKVYTYGKLLFYKFVEQVEQIS